jgi:Tfp pilus assembly protein PilE
MARGHKACTGAMLVKAMIAVAIVGLLWAIVLPAFRVP